ncbi:hypothetical protein LA080_008221 [Diaporthe eres]|nr:hypothetical protein LA080_008221 [Diaporthe eres]
MKHIQSTHGEDLPNSNFPDVLELSGFSIAELKPQRSSCCSQPLRSERCSVKVLGNEQVLGQAEDEFVASRQSIFLKAALERLCTCYCVKVAHQIPNCLKQYGRKTGLCGLASDFRWGLGSLMLCDCLNCCQQIASNHLYHGARVMGAIQCFQVNHADWPPKWSSSRIPYAAAAMSHLYTEPQSFLAMRPSKAQAEQIRERLGDDLASAHFED